MSPQVYPPDYIAWLYGRPVRTEAPHPNPLDPIGDLWGERPQSKHEIFCATDGCQQVARIKVDGLGYCDEHARAVTVTGAYVTPS